MGAALVVLCALTLYVLYVRVHPRHGPSTFLWSPPLLGMVWIRVKQALGRVCQRNALASRHPFAGPFERDAAAYCTQRFTVRCCRAFDWVLSVLPRASDHSTRKRAHVCVSLFCLF